MNGHKGQIVGYARVSAADQNEARQVEALSDVDRLFCEKVSGKHVEDRTQLRELLEWVRDGDKVRVVPQANATPVATQPPKAGVAAQ